MGLLEGKTVLIAGCGEGLGTAAARLFAEHGAEAALMARTDRVTKGLAAELVAGGRRAAAIQGDMTRSADCRRAVQETLDAFGKIDCLVTVAFVGDSPHRKSLVDSDENLDFWRPLFEVNLFGTMLMLKAVLTHMAERRSGTVALVNSMTAERVLPNAASYAASKAALQRASQCVALEVAPLGIRVNSLHPGYIWNDTVMTNCEVYAERNGTTAEEERQKVLNTIPFGYMATPEDYAGTLLYLVSDLSKHMIGGSLHVNGGQFIR